MRERIAVDSKLGLHVNAARFAVQRRRYRSIFRYLHARGIGKRCFAIPAIEDEGGTNFQPLAYRRKERNERCFGHYIIDHIEQAHGRVKFTARQFLDGGTYKIRAEDILAAGYFNRAHIRINAANRKAKEHKLDCVLTSPASDI